MTFRNKGFGEMPSSPLDSHQNSVQNGTVERLIALMATIFVLNFNFYAAATLCPLDGNGKTDNKNIKNLRKAGQGVGARGAKMQEVANLTRCFVQI